MIMIVYYNAYDRKRRKIDDNNDEVILKDTATTNSAQSSKQNTDKHTTILPLASAEGQPEKRRYVLDVMNDPGNPSPSVINLNE